MNDISFFALQFQKGALATQLIRDTVNFSKPHAEEGVLFTWRWHFFLGTLPLPAGDDMQLSACRTACDVWRSQWCDAGRRLDQSLRDAPRRSVKAVKFDESSSDSDDAVPSASAAAAPATGATSSGGGGTVNPLQPASESSYALQFQADAVRQTVAKDLSRLFWDVPLFRDPHTKEVVADVLLKYCMVENREYKQGFHELVAFLYCACHRDKGMGERFARESPALRSSAFFQLFAHVYTDLPAAVYALFRRLVSDGDDGVGMGLARWYYVDNYQEQSGVVAACERVQQDLLARIDPPLQHLLDANYDIQSVVYLVRWLRLLFLREFPLEQSLHIWTILFCERFAIDVERRAAFVLDDSVALYFAVQMLRHIRGALASDASEAMRLLMRYPPTENVGDVLYAAVVSNSDSPLARYATAPRLVDPRDAPVLPADVTLRQGEVLARVIAGLEQYWFRNATATPEEQEWGTEVYIQSIAQLKKVRDVLLYGMGNDA
ncbi:Rab-GTPase-TBC domain containing protein [Novymonas esmeraldas]|uniref:Rab-GTPase-TBC domain containing protein n=1 Tax=Novymonas esmeraldas TaxID=1808958 RepID=A0AAW0ET80_9TRYP